MRIAVTGALGQLGAAVVHECRSAHEVTAFAHADLDITDGAAVASAMDRARPQVIINCAAYNDVDRAEDHPVDALNGNAFSVLSLVRAAVDHGATLVHYSTDFVFDGTASAPYSEDDPANPRSVYAASKLLGEWFAADAPRAYVLWVESLFGCAPEGRPAKGSVAVILNTLVAGSEVRVFKDRTVSPTYVVDAARATRRLLEAKAAAGRGPCVHAGDREVPRLGVLGMAPNQKIGERLVGGMQLRADAAARQPEVGQPNLRQQLSGRLNEGLERQPVALVVVFSVLISDRRPQPYVAANRAGQMHAEPVARRMRQRIHERADERPSGRRELSIFAAARIDGEALTTECA